MIYVRVGGNKFYGQDVAELIKNVKVVHDDVDEAFISKIAKPTATTVLSDFLKRKNAKPRKKSVSFKEGLVGAQALVKNLAGFGVEQSELNRRAAVCSGCPMVSDFTDCKACGAAAKINNKVESMRQMLSMGGKVYPNGLKDKSCKHCGCALSVMMATKMSNFLEREEGISITRPKNCWLNPTSPNFVNE
jgi:hypothetical protein